MDVKTEYEKISSFLDRWRSAFTFDGQISSGKLKLVEADCARLIDELSESAGNAGLEIAWIAVGGIPGVDVIVRRQCERKGYRYE